MESTLETSVKIAYNGEMRRFPFTGTSFQALNDRVLEVLGLVSTTPVVLKYRDEDNDLVTITTDVELKCALAPGKVLRLEVFPKNSVPTYSAPTGVSSFVTPAGTETQAPPTDAAPMAFPFGRGGLGRGGFGRGGFPCGRGSFGRGGFGRGGFSPFGRGPFAGPCIGKAGWQQYKKEMKERKKNLSPEEWDEFKSQYKQAKEHVKGVHKMMKKGHKHGLHAAMFGAHHGHPGPHGHGPHGHGPHTFGPHTFGPHFAGDAAMPQGADGTHVPPTGFAHPHEFAHPPGFAPQPGFVPPFDFGNHPFFGHHHSEKLIARHVKDVTIEDGTQIPAGTQFVKTWRVRNEGQPWPAGCRLTYNSCEKHASGDNMSGPEYVVVEAAVATNEEVDISVPLVAPTQPGRYTGYWKMCTPDGRKFGQRLWVTIKVSASGSSSSEEDREADRYEALVDVVLGMGFNVKRHRVFRLLQKHDGNVDKVALKLAAMQQKFERKAVEKAQKDSMMTF